MGQKVNPNILRLGISQNWDSIWYSERNYCLNLKEHLKIRDLIFYVFKNANINKIIIERPAKKSNNKYIRGKTRVNHRKGRK